MITVSETPWVRIAKGDPSWHLEGPVSVTGRAAIDVTDACPADIARIIIMAAERGWIKPVAYVPKDDPTLMWDRLKND